MEGWRNFPFPGVFRLLGPEGQMVVRVTHLLYRNMSGFHTFDASTLIAFMSPKLELFHFKNGLCHAYKNDDKKTTLRRIH